MYGFLLDCLFEPTQTVFEEVVATFDGSVPIYIHVSRDQSYCSRYTALQTIINDVWSRNARAGKAPQLPCILKLNDRVLKWNDFEVPQFEHVQDGIAGCQKSTWSMSLDNMGAALRA